jgi:hypothetical protein
VARYGMSRSFRSERDHSHEGSSRHLIAEVLRRQARGEMSIAIDLGNVWSHYCTLNEGREVVDRVRFRTSPKAIEKWFTAVLPARVAMKADRPTL